MRFSLEQGSGSFLGMVTTIWKLNVESEIIPLTGKHGSVSGRCDPGDVFNDVNCQDEALHIAALHMHMVGLQQHSTCSLSCFNPYPT